MPKSGWGGFKISVFLAKYGFSTVWHGEGWCGQWPPPLVGQDPFFLGIPEPFVVPFWFLYFSPPQAAVAVEQSS